MSTKLTKAVARKIDKTTKGAVPAPKKLLAADLLAQLRAEIIQWHVGAARARRIEGRRHRQVKRIQSDLLKMAKQIGAAFALDTS
jgi:hypothetical protein